MNSGAPRILLAASVPGHFRAFHLPWVERLRELGCVVHGAADRITEMSECVAAFNEVHDVPFSRNPLDLRAARAAGRTIAPLMDQKQFDLVHVHTPVAAYITRRYAHPFRARGAKTVYTAHGFHFHRNGSPLTNFIFQTVEKHAGRWTDYLVVINHDDEAAARDLKIVPPEDVFYMPGVGIDLEQFSPACVSAADIQRVRDELKLSPNDKLVTMVAELIVRKRHRDVVQAIARLNRSDIHVAFVGDGSHRAKIEAQVAQLGLGKTIHFLGFRRDIPALFRAATCAILTSQFEGLPRSVMEALCMEVPVVGSDTRGIRDLLAGGGGIIVPIGDTARLAETIRDLIDNPERSRAIGAAGRRSMAPYSLANVLSLNEQLYKRALGVRFPI
jgi:glycosyltransferase involved in cell wall biosynthesis